MKRRFLQYCSIFMVMMFISNIKLANFYTPSAKTSQENSYTQKQESSFWAKFVSSLASEIEKIEEKTEQEDNENSKLFINNSSFSLLYSSLKYQKNLFFFLSTNSSGSYVESVVQYFVFQQSYFFQHG